MHFADQVAFALEPNARQRRQVRRTTPRGRVLPTGTRRPGIAVVRAGGALAPASATNAISLGFSEIVAGVTDAREKQALYTLAFSIVRADESVSGAERIYLAQLAALIGLGWVLWRRATGSAARSRTPSCWARWP